MHSSFEEGNTIIPMLQIRQLKMSKSKFILPELEFQPRESGYGAHISNFMLPPRTQTLNQEYSIP